MIQQFQGARHLGITDLATACRCPRQRCTQSSRRSSHTVWSQKNTRAAATCLPGAA